MDDYTEHERVVNEMLAGFMKLIIDCGEPPPNMKFMFGLYNASIDYAVWQSINCDSDIENALALGFIKSRLNKT